MRESKCDMGYTSQGANRAAVYQMISLVCFEEEDGDSAEDSVAGSVNDTLDGGTRGQVPRPT